MTRAADPGGGGGEPRRILVASLDNLGDLVFATVLIEPLRRTWPAARIHYWTRRYTAGLLQDDADVEGFAADPPWTSGAGRAGVLPFVRGLRALRALEFDLTFIPNTEWRRCVALALAGAGRRIGHARRKSRALLHMAVPVDRAGRHAIDDLGDLLRAAGVPEELVREARPRLVVGPESVRRAARFLEAAGIAPGERLVAVHAFSGDRRKNWPAAAWCELLRRLEAAGTARIVLVRGPGEDPAPLLQELLRPDHVVAQPMDLPALKGVLARAEALVGHDSGPMHVASALGVPVVALFGPTDPVRVGPAGRSPSRVLHRDPIGGIRVEQVLGALGEIAPRAGVLQP